jgi:hypothetical protein
MIPLYGFLEGDTIGLVVFAYPEDSVSGLAEKLQRSASIRVAPRASVHVVYEGRRLEPDRLVFEIGFRPLDRFDVRGGPE